MAESKPIPVFLFTGFLDAGKTTFIQSTLEDKRFNAGQKILLLRCEEGEEEYDFSAFTGKNVFLRDLENEEDFNEARLMGLLTETGAERVLIEYNGMWSLQTLYDELPENWIVAQEICFADANTYTVFNANMRNLVFEKLQTCNVMEFNRCSDDMDLDALHKIVRQANRRCNIFYDYPDGRSVQDEKQDPLPFDIHAPVVTIEDRDYAYFYADLMENTKDYEKKIVEFVGLYPKESKRLAPGFFVAGRMLMNCCAADTQFAGMACYCDRQTLPEKGNWYRLKGKIRLQRNNLFAGKVPILDVISFEPTAEPEEPVATFY